MSNEQAKTKYSKAQEHLNDYLTSVEEDHSNFKDLYESDVEGASPGDISYTPQDINLQASDNKWITFRKYMRFKSGHECSYDEDSETFTITIS